MRYQRVMLGAERFLGGFAGYVSEFFSFDCCIEGLESRQDAFPKNGAAARPIYFSIRMKKRIAMQQPASKVISIPPP
jgi:hypothetical protein